MISNFHTVLLVLLVLLGLVVSAPFETRDDLIREYINQKDGTVDHFAYHNSFVGKSDMVLEYNMMDHASTLSTALEKRDVAGESLLAI